LNGLGSLRWSGVTGFRNSIEGSLWWSTGEGGGRGGVGVVLHWDSIVGSFGGVCGIFSITLFLLGFVILIYKVSECFQEIEF